MYNISELGMYNISKLSLIFLNVKKSDVLKKKWKKNFKNKKIQVTLLPEEEEPYPKLKIGEAIY
jgi:hypothetical protein